MSSTDSLKRNDLLDIDELRARFDALDYTVFGAVLLISVSIGVLFWLRGQKNVEEFLMASRSMSALPVAMSVCASFFSAITLVGIPAIIYAFGTGFAGVLISAPFTLLVATKFFIPVFYQLKVTSSNEYLQLRFGQVVRAVVGIAFLATTLIYMSIVVYAPSLAIEVITGIDPLISCATIFVVCIFYTTIGGLRAVIWTDVFQATVMFVAMIAIIIKGTSEVGGLGVVFDRNYQASRINTFNFTADPRVKYSLLTTVFGGFFYGAAGICVNPMNVQRALACESEKTAKKALKLCIPLNMAMLALPMLCGMVAYAYYHDCDPIQAKQVAKPDQIIPHFVMQVMGHIPAIAGLFVGGILSATLSTVSSALNAAATVLYVDFIKPNNKGGRLFKATVSKEMLLTKIISLVFGSLSFALVFVVAELPGVLQAALTLIGIVNGPIFGVFTLGMFIPFASNRGALVGLILGFVIMMWIGYGQLLSIFYGTYGSTSPVAMIYDNPKIYKYGWSPIKLPSTAQCPDSWIPASSGSAGPPPAPSEPSTFPHLVIYEVSYLMFTFMGWALTMILGTLTSLWWPQNSRHLDPRLVTKPIPCIAKAIMPKFTGIGEKVEKYWSEIGALRSEATASEEIRIKIKAPEELKI